MLYSKPCKPAELLLDQRPDVGRNFEITGLVSHEPWADRRRVRESTGAVVVIPAEGLEDARRICTGLG